MSDSEQISANSDIKFGHRIHGMPIEQLTEDNFDSLPALQKLLRIGVTHGCPNPKAVALEMAQDMVKNEGKDMATAIDDSLNWLIERQMDCNNEFNNILGLAKDLNPNLYHLLMQPVDRLADEPVGTYEPRYVTKDHAIRMNPGSTPWGYALPRVKIEQMGRDEQRSEERTQKSNELTRKAILSSHTPIELLTTMAGLMVTSDYGGEGDADPIRVLEQTLSGTVLHEEGTKQIYRDITSSLKKKAPKLYTFYESMDTSTLRRADIIPQEDLSSV